MRARLCCVLFMLMPLAALAEDNPLGISVVETRDGRVIYFDELSYLVPHAVRTFTNSIAWQRRMFGWVPSESTTVLLKDLADYGGGAAAVAPRNRLIADIAPISHAFETYPASERMYSLMNHELVHVATGDIASDAVRRWRRLLLGKVYPQPANPESLYFSYLTTPRFNTPRWYLEGSAVFMETWMSGGLGRAQGGYDEMVFRAMVRDGSHFYAPLGLEARGTLVDFQVGANAYLYGTRFFTWLAYQYSPEKVVAWLRLDDGGEPHYADQFQKVFGIPLEQGWQDWIAFERGFQQRNLAEVRQHPITPHRTLTSSTLGSISRIYYDEANGTIYGALRSPGIVEYVGALNTRDGSIRRIADIKRAMLYRVASFAFDPDSGTAFWTDDNLALRDLMAVNVKTGASRMLLEDARIGEIVFNPADRSLLGVRHVNGIAVLVRIPYPYTEWKDIYAFPYESVPYDLDISPDGRLLSASMSEVNSDQFLRVWEMAKILEGNVEPLSEFRFGQSIPESFVFSRDGKYLYGSSYYTGVSNIFRYEVSTGKVDAVSNAESGFFRPIPLSDGRLLVLTYTGDGFVPAIIDAQPIEDISAIKFLGAELVDRYPVIKTWQVPPPSTVDYDQVVTRTGPFVPLKSMALDNAFPVLQGYKNSAGIGYHVNIADSLGFAGVGITAAYTPTGNLRGEERGHVDITGHYLGWHGELSWNHSDFYDLFGPTRKGRKGYAAKVGYDDLLIYDDPRKLELKYALEYYDQIDTLPGAQNVGTAFTRLLTAEVGLHYTDVRRSLGAVDDEKGIAWAAVATANRVNDSVPIQVRGNFDFGLPLPLRHSSIWLRSAAGAASGDRANSVANFYFGGFGNNYVDRGEVKRYRDYDSLPGFGINEISGLSFVRELVEWNLPPFVFESAGAPGFHATWLRPAVFATALWTDPGHSAYRKDYTNVGVQADIRFSVLHWYEMTLSAGYAVGFRGGNRSGDEWMLSLKIM